MTNDQAILERIAQNPKCRAVQLADWLDADVDDVGAQLAALISVGDVVLSHGTAPNGTPCALYDLTEAFKASKAYEPILAKTLAAHFATFRPDLGKTDRAVEFVRERGMATSAELHAVLGLAPDEYASTYLRSAITSARLVKDGKTWTLGPKESGPAKEVTKVPVHVPGAAFPTVAPTTAPAVASTKPDALESGADLGRIRPELPVPTFVPTAAPTTAPTSAPTVAPAPKPRSTTSRNRYAVWSDGKVEIKVPGNPSLELSREEFDDLVSFVTQERA